MAQVDQTVINIRGRTSRAVKLIEQAQAEAAAAVQEWNKLGGEAMFSGYEWPEGSDITQAEFTTGVSSLSTAMPDILGDHGTNLYKMRS